MARRILGGVAGALTAALGALILGEYPFSGLVVVGAAVVFGLFVGEVVVAVGRWRGAAAGVVCAALTGGGLLWAAWIAEGHDLGYLAGEGWAAIALGMAVGALRGWRPGGATGSPTAPAAPP